MSDALAGVVAVVDAESLVGVAAEPAPPAEPDVPLGEPPVVAGSEEEPVGDASVDEVGSDVGDDAVVVVEPEAVVVGAGGAVAPDDPLAAVVVLPAAGGVVDAVTEEDVDGSFADGVDVPPPEDGADGSALPADGVDVDAPPPPEDGGDGSLLPADGVAVDAPPPPEDGGDGAAPDSPTVVVPAAESGVELVPPPGVAVESAPAPVVVEPALVVVGWLATTPVRGAVPVAPAGRPGEPVGFAVVDDSGPFSGDREAVGGVDRAARGNATRGTGLE